MTSTEHTFSVLIGRSGVSVWCEGRDYEPEDSAYRPRYAYKIKTPDWEYVGNDLHGAVNEEADTNKAMQSVLSFLYACQEGYLHDPNNEGENAGLFPPHVREWAYMNNDEISTAAIEEGIANTYVAAAKLSDPDDIVEDDDNQFHHCPRCNSVCAINDYSDGRCVHCTQDVRGIDVGDTYTGPVFRETDDDNS